MCINKKKINTIISDVMNCSIFENRTHNWKYSHNNNIIITQNSSGRISNLGKRKYQTEFVKKINQGMSK